MAVPDFRGSGASQSFMGAFNETLFSDLQNSGLFEMVAKGMYPLQVPQRPEDFRQPPAPARLREEWRSRTGPRRRSNANFLVTGYTAEQNSQIVLYGWLFDVGQPNMANAQILGKRYFGPVDETGARKVAHEFAADILAHWGGTSLYGTHIYFVSDRTGTGNLVHGPGRRQSEAVDSFQIDFHHACGFAGWHQKLHLLASRAEILLYLYSLRRLGGGCPFIIRLHR